MWVFSDTSTSQHHNVVLHTLTHTLTNTLTHTHMTGQQWLVGQVVPGEFFSGFCKIGFLGPEVVSKTFFFDRQGVTQHPKIFSSECVKLFLLFMCIFVCRHYAANLVLVRITAYL